MSAKPSIHLSVISVVVFLFVTGAFAQGLLGKLKKGALDAAKETVNEAVNQTAPAVPPQNAGNPAPNNQAADAERQRLENEQRQRSEEDKKWAETEARQKEIQAEREAAITKMDAEQKEREAKRKAEQTEREQREKEDEARREKEQEEQQMREKDKAREEIFEELRTGGIKTADAAKARLNERGLWQEGMEDKLKEIVAERMEKIAQHKFPVSDTFKVPVKIYKEFESGMSLEWCTVKLETDGSKFYAHNNKIVLETDNGKVTLIFEKVLSEKAPVLTACVVDLPPNVRHAQVLEKYKREIPNATVKHEAPPKKLPDMNEYVQNGISLLGQFSMIQLTDTVASPAQTVTIESSLIVGKAYLKHHSNNRNVLICEFSSNGTVTIPDGLDTRQKESAGMIKELLVAKMRNVAVLIEDNAMAKALQDLQKEQQENEKKKQQQKDAEALAF